MRPAVKEEALHWLGPLEAWGDASKRPWRLQRAKLCQSMSAVPGYHTLPVLQAVIMVAEQPRHTEVVQAGEAAVMFALLH